MTLASIIIMFIVCVDNNLMIKRSSFNLWHFPLFVGFNFRYFSMRISIVAFNEQEEDEEAHIAAKNRRIWLVNNSWKKKKTIIRFASMEVIKIKEKALGKHNKHRRMHTSSNRANNPKEEELVYEAIMSCWATIIWSAKCRRSRERARTRLVMFQLLMRLIYRNDSSTDIRLDNLLASC